MKTYCVSGTMQGTDLHFPLRLTNPGSKESTSWQGLNEQKHIPSPFPLPPPWWHPGAKRMMKLGSWEGNSSPSTSTHLTVNKAPVSPGTKRRSSLPLQQGCPEGHTTCIPQLHRGRSHPHPVKRLLCSFPNSSTGCWPSSSRVPQTRPHHPTQQGQG